jgi:hypothetical protein
LTTNIIHFEDFSSPAPKVEVKKSSPFSLHDQEYLTGCLFVLPGVHANDKSKGLSDALPAHTPLFMCGITNRRAHLSFCLLIHAQQALQKITHRGFDGRQ